MGYIANGNLSVDAALLTFINDTLLPEAGKDAASFWTGFDKAVHELAPKNIELIKGASGAPIFYNDKIF